MKKKELYQQLADRYINRTASVEELQVFFHLLEKGKLRKQLIQATRGKEEKATGGLLVMIPRYRAIGRYVIAAAVIGLLGLSIFLLTRHGNSEKEAPLFVMDMKDDIAPGGNHATLTLSDGSCIKLDSLGNGSQIKEGKAKLTATNSGSLLYEAPAGSSTVKLYNTITTPAGGQYQVTLPDGTRVWLNSLSSIKFSTTLGRVDRLVELTGEAFFDVAKDKKRPFHVKTKDVEVQVLGTAFNMNTYPDESSIKTTLVQGSVKLVKGAESLLILPGQEGQVSEASGLVLDQTVNVEQVTAWKDGTFNFDSLDTRAVMRQIARWYGIEVRFEGKPSSAPFEGKMQRDLRLSQALAGLGKCGVRCRFDGKILTVLP